MKLTPGAERALEKACRDGKLFMARGFSEQADTAPVKSDRFDSRLQIDRLVNAKLLAFGEAWNTYHPTPAAYRDLAETQQSRRDKEAAKADKKRSRKHA